MSNSDLASVLKSIPWNENVNALCGHSRATERIESGLIRIALWAQQLEIADKNNPALCFVREMQVQGHFIAALLGAALYKPVATAQRALVENALYYSYFRTHPKELATLVRDARYYEEKTSIVEFHKQHSSGFVERDLKMSIVGRLNDWYKNISAIVHGQIPGKWIGHSSLADICHAPALIDEALEKFEAATSIVNDLFLATVAQDLWSDFSREVRKELLKGLSGDVRTILALPTA